MANSYEVPSWAGKPPTGLHLDVLKEDKLIQKLMIDQKKCYLFGRNAQMNDFCIDHASCSRVHAAFVYHKHLNIAYLVDLGSTHGTYIGNLRLEGHKPTQLQIDSTFHFGASTRKYILRERPSAGIRANIIEDLPLSEMSDGTLLGLPESQTELDNLTEYNTAHNRRILMIGISDESIRKQNANKPNRKHRSVTFNEDEIIINPEDVDPNVGRFRNLVHSTVVPSKRAKYETNCIGIPTTSTNSYNHTADLKILHSMAGAGHLYQGLPDTSDHIISNKLNTSLDLDVLPITIGGKLGLILPNPAPDVTPTEEIQSSSMVQFGGIHGPRYEDHSLIENSNEPQKKKYAKEAWPGRKPLLGPL